MSENQKETYENIVEPWLQKDEFNKKIKLVFFCFVSSFFDLLLIYIYNQTIVQ